MTQSSEEIPQKNISLYDLEWLDSNFAKLKKIYLSFYFVKINTL